ncbi:MAG: D-glycero-beta-D-manno-heptose 1-phosphate adenylyltransferase [Candidatus Omnitrophica bacterium]|nr:D-glycero-beta-D-manno-heptose 1-phosphate adenylyltransferase [Candidatus Omnitrophota bacterium]
MNSKNDSVLRSRRKVVTLSTLKRKLPALRKSGKEIAFTNGCFDIIHYGHVCYLQKAKKNERVLIIGLNSDISIRKIKGPSRPINKQNHRAGVLAALSCVDYIVLFDESTPYHLIKSVKPDVMIKGSDWKGKDVAGSDIVQGYGGNLELISFVPNCSTTKIIEKIRKSDAKKR